MDADVRVTRAEEYGKCKAAVAAITPVGDVSYQPAPLTPMEKEFQKKTAGGK
jgi:hypothetical protein